MCPCDALVHGFLSLASETKKNSPMKGRTASIWAKLELKNFFLLSQEQ